MKFINILIILLVIVAIGAAISFIPISISTPINETERQTIFEKTIYVYNTTVIYINEGGGTVPSTYTYTSSTGCDPNDKSKCGWAACPCFTVALVPNNIGLTKIGSANLMNVYVPNVIPHGTKPFEIKGQALVTRDGGFMIECGLDPITWRSLSIIPIAAAGSKCDGIANVAGHVFSDSTKAGDLIEFTYNIYPYNVNNIFSTGNYRVYCGVYSHCWVSGTTNHIGSPIGAPIKISSYMFDDYETLVKLI